MSGDKFEIPPNHRAARAMEELRASCREMLALLDASEAPDPAPTMRLQAALKEYVAAIVGFARRVTKDGD